MNKLRIGLQSFTKEEVDKFEKMHKDLEEFNRLVGSKNELPMPKYSDSEMAELSGYRQMVIGKECEE